MTRPLLYLAVLFLTVGCGPLVELPDTGGLLRDPGEELTTREARRYRKAARKINRAIELWPALLRVDTIVVRDTVIFPGDTVERYVTRTLPGDTVVVERPGGVRTVVVRVPTGTPCDTVPSDLYVRTEVPPDTSTVETRVEVPGVEPIRGAGVSPFWKWLALGLAAVVLILYLFRR